MSILRYFNKHHGWYGGARTPYGGPEEVIAAEVIGEMLAPEAAATVAPEVIGAGAYEAGLAGTAGESALYGAGAYGAGEGAAYGAGAYGAGEGAAYVGSEIAAEQAAQEAARQAAIQNAGNMQLGNIPANQMGSFSGDQFANLSTELNAAANNPAYSNVVADATNSTVSNAPDLVGESYAVPRDPTAGYAGTEQGIVNPSVLPQTPTSQMPTLPGGIKDYLPSKNQMMVGGGLYALNSLMNQDKNKYGVPAAEKYSGPLSKFKYDPNTYQYTTPVNRQYTPNYRGYAGAGYAEGGITDINQNQNYANGGIAGLLKGRGDGMSDSIRATIADKQPARLADGEFVVPADVVSHLGNGSTDAGAKHLYKMMDKVRHARTGTKKQGKQIAAGGYLPIK